MARPKKFDENLTLEKALRVFWQKGYAATSMQDLVEAMGINAPSLYAAYGSKHALFLKALRHYQQDQHRWMGEVLGGNGPVKEAIGQLLEALVHESLQDPEGKGCFMVNTTTELANQDPEIAGLVAGNEQQVREMLAGLIQNGQDRGEIASHQDPRVLATYLFALIQGLRITAATNKDKSLLQGTLQTALSVL